MYLISHGHGDSGAPVGGELQGRPHMDEKYHSTCFSCYNAKLIILFILIFFKYAASSLSLLLLASNSSSQWRSHH